METPINAQPQKAKREQRYYRFRFQQGDMELIEQLRPEHREVLLLSEGSYVERAARLNIAVGTLRSRLHRARAALEALRAGVPVVDSRIEQLN
jgi:DNA-directed RNA polymerase specialized sigma24 family protein